MNRRRALVGSGFVVLAGTLIAGVLAARGNGPALAVAQTSRAPVALSGTDPVTGKHVALASFRGKPVVLNVWGSWCTECRAEAAALARFARTHPYAQVVGLDVGDTRDAAKAFYRRWHWRHPSIGDPHGDLAARLAIRGMPTTIFLNGRHQMAGSIVGASDLAGFAHGLRLALRED